MNNADIAWYSMVVVMISVPILNLIVAPILDRHTKPINDHSNDGGSAFLFLFFGIFCLPFVRSIRKSRLIDYLIEKYNSKVQEFNKLVFVSGVYYNSSTEIEIKNLKKEIRNLKIRIELVKLKNN